MKRYYSLTKLVIVFITSILIWDDNGAAEELVSFAAVFRDVTQRSLRDIPKDGCEGDYWGTRSLWVSLFYAKIDYQEAITDMRTKDDINVPLNNIDFAHNRWGLENKKKM